MCICAVGYKGQGSDEIVCHVRLRKHNGAGPKCRNKKLHYKNIYENRRSKIPNHDGSIHCFHKINKKKKKLSVLIYPVMMEILFCKVKKAETYTQIIKVMILNCKMYVYGTYHGVWWKQDTDFLCNRFTNFVSMYRNLKRSLRQQDHSSRSRLTAALQASSVRGPSTNVPFVGNCMLTLSSTWEARKRWSIKQSSFFWARLLIDSKCPVSS